VKNGLTCGMPYLFAPGEQTKVPIIVWVGDSSDIDLSSALTSKNINGGLQNANWRPLF